MQIKDIPGFLKYKATGEGEVISTYHNCRDSELKVLRPHTTREGYLRVSVYGDEGVRCNMLVHRLIALAFDIAGDGSEVNHLDGDKRNNKPSNLEWVTRSENLRHAFKTGLCKPLTGEANPASKYTRGQALYILRNPTMPRRELMERLDCSLTFVKSVRSGKTWSHLNEEI